MECARTDKHAHSPTHSVTRSHTHARARARVSIRHAAITSRSSVTRRTHSLQGTVTSRALTDPRTQAGIPSTVLVVRSRPPGRRAGGVSARAAGGVSATGIMIDFAVKPQAVLSQHRDS